MYTENRVTKCAACKKEFYIPDRDMWAYKSNLGNNSYKYFCTYSCLRKFQKENERK